MVPAPTFFLRTSTSLSNLRGGREEGEEKKKEANVRNVLAERDSVCTEPSCPGGGHAQKQSTTVKERH